MTARGAGRVSMLVVFALVASRGFGAAPDAGAIIASLAREAPSSIAFTEARFSSLLREPLIVSGELGYLGAGSLERRVLRPYTETTTIVGESVRIERDGETSRTFGLKRVPELQTFLDAFVGLLAGDAASLGRSFDIVASGDANEWQLDLTPKEQRTRRRLREVQVTGRAAEPRCFAILDTQGGGSVIFVGAASQPIDPGAAIESLLARCRAE